MTETKKRSHKAQTIEDLEASIKKMEAELAEGYGRPLSWEEVTTTTAEELAAKEQRRSILPRLTTAAKIKRLELQRERWEIEPLEVERDEAYERLEAAPERRTIDNALRGGQAPRSVVRRYSGLNRKALTRHRDNCLEMPREEGGA
jgi:hypothetical protein